MKKEKIYLSPPHLSGREQKYVEDAFSTNWVAPIGPNVDFFEKELAEYVGVKEAVAVSSGTAAIHLALSLLGVTKGDIVFCSSLTFVASANPILYQGAEVVFIDSEWDTWNMSPQALERALSDAKKNGKLPKAIILVHLYGQSAKMDELLTLSEAYGVPIIEDAAESLGSLYKGHASGALGEIGIFSFNGNKIITTSSGGMLVTNNEELAKKAKFLATQAKDDAIHYQHSVLGFNYRMSNILAGIGRGQLEVLEERILARRNIFDTYTKLLQDEPSITFMPELKDTKSNRWLTTFVIDESVSGTKARPIIEELLKNDIEARPVWKPLHLQPLYNGAAYYAHNEKESVSESLYGSGICLPSGSSLTYEDQERIVTNIKQLLKVIV